MGGDAYRVAIIGHYVGSLTPVLASILLARSLGLASLALLGLLGVAAHPGAATRVAGLGPVSAALAALPLVALAAAGRFDYRERGGVLWRRLGALDRAFRLHRSSAGTLAGAAALSLLLQGNVVCQYWLLSLVLGSDMGFAVLLMAVPIVSLAAMLPSRSTASASANGRWCGCSPPSASRRPTRR